MDEFDGFAPGDDGEGFGEDGEGFDSSGEAAPFDDFDEPENTEDLAGFDDFGGDGDEGLSGGLEDAFDVDDDFEAGSDTADEPAEGSDEAAYAATYEDMLVDEADNPPAFPPELDMDVPEPVDGYPWVDLDSLGEAETEPWAVNTAGGGDFATADLDDPAAGALARFWQE